MVPVPALGMWHEEQIDELFASLLGKGFENEADTDPPEKDVEGASLEDELNEALKGGFRVFG
jgi:protein AATF/BFR2